MFRVYHLGSFAGLSYRSIHVGDAAERGLQPYEWSLEDRYSCTQKRGRFTEDLRKNRKAGTRSHYEPGRDQGRSNPTLISESAMPTTRRQTTTEYLHRISLEAQLAIFDNSFSTSGGMEKLPCRKMTGW